MESASASLIKVQNEERSMSGKYEVHVSSERARSDVLEAEVTDITGLVVKDEDLTWIYGSKEDCLGEIKNAPYNED